MAKNDVEAEFMRKRELILEKISVLKNRKMSISDFYKCTNDIIFEVDEESDMYTTKKCQKEAAAPLSFLSSHSASFYKNSASLQAETAWQSAQRCSKTPKTAGRLSSTPMLLSNSGRCLIREDLSNKYPNNDQQQSGQTSARADEVMKTIQRLKVLDIMGEVSERHEEE